MKEKYINIPLTILSNENLNSNDKIIYGIINNWSKKIGWCYITNKKISKMMNITEKTTQNSINNLIKYNLIEKNKTKKGKKVIRILKPTNTKEIKEFIEYDWLSDT